MNRSQLRLMEPISVNGRPWDESQSIRVTSGGGGGLLCTLFLKPHLYPPLFVCSAVDPSLFEMEHPLSKDLMGVGPSSIPRWVFVGEQSILV